VLGGDFERERLAAQMAAGTYSGSFSEMCATTWVTSSKDVQGAGKVHSKIVDNEELNELCSKIPVYVSSGHGNAQQVMLDAGVTENRLYIDNRAVDTVTNFTTLASDFRKRRFQHVLVVTSDYHARRASLVALVTLGGIGIATTTLFVPSSRYANGERKESASRIARDMLRALLWSICGIHGGLVGRWIHPERFSHSINVKKET